MKFKSLRKLALSGVALAAAATTLGTSTFAWYVTNSEARVSGVQGTAKAGGLGNILVAQAMTGDGAVNGHGGFETSISLDTGNITGTSAAKGLTPVLPVAADASITTNAATTSSNANITVDKVATLINGDTKWIDSKGAEVAMPAANATAGSVPYIQFDVWVLNSASSSVYFEFSITNTTTTANLVNQLAYSNTGVPNRVNGTGTAATTTAVKQGETFNANIIDALRMSYSQLDYTTTDGTTYTAGSNPTASTILDVAAEAKNEWQDNTYTSGGNANAYYNSVLGKNDAIVTSATSAIASGTKKQTITVVQGQETKLSFYIWLEGSDQQCFDSVSGQSFEITLTFSK